MADGKRKTLTVDRVKFPLHLKFNDLSVKVNGKHILKNVSGEVKPGETIAIMGPSGAGKSTLLNILAGRFNGMELESGCVLVNNQKLNKQLRRKIGYVTQEDVFFNHLTVRQTLQFVADIVLPDSHSKEKRVEIFNNVINTLNLNKCLETAIGGGIFTSGCSGGEKKRCSIAMELIKNPSLLMLDEPTSGLDAAIASTLIKSIKTLATATNCAVLTSIHQPSSHVFHMFDKLLLLSNGEVAYYGKTDGVLPFFDSMGMPCYPNWNPADYILEKLSDGNEKHIVERFSSYKRKPDDKQCEHLKVSHAENNAIYKSENSVVHFIKEDKSKGVNGNIGVANHSDGADKFINSGYEADLDDCGTSNKDSQTDDSIEITFDSELTPDNDVTSTNLQKWPTCFQTQFVALSKRAFIQTRKYVLDKISMVQTIAVALTCFLVWFNMPFDEDSITDRRGVIFYLIIYHIFNTMFKALLAFGPERDAITKERSNGMYRLSAYFMAKNMSEFPVLIFQPILFYSTVYWGSGLNRSPMFLVGLLLLITICLVSQGIGYCIGCAIKNLQKALTTGLVISLAAMLTGGFYARRLPKWLLWAKYISYVSHAYNVQHRLEFEYATRTFRCRSTGSMFNECNMNSTLVIHGRDIQEQFETLSIGIGESFAALWAYIIIFRVLFYILLKYLYRAK